jgi:demethylmenaquinone methyltransferase/2-methoxy-6-polyprenyl-1,4-benzoquinol methylase
LPVIDKLYDLYSFSILPKIGGMVTGNEEAYRYLVESIRKFPPQDEFISLIEAAGMERARYRNLSGGIAAIHSAWRL